MGQTGFWYVVEASDASAVEVAKYLDVLWHRLTPTVGPFLERWHLYQDQPLHEEEEPTGVSVEQFLQAFGQAHVPEELFYACADPRLDEHTWDLSNARNGNSARAVLAAIPSIPPAAVLLAGLGARRAGLIPGRMGMFSLTHSELTKTAENIRKAHGLAPQRRYDSLEQMHRLMDAVGVPNYPISNLLEGLPAALSSALADGKGLIAVSALI